MLIPFSPDTLTYMSKQPRRKATSNSVRSLSLFLSLFLSLSFSLSLSLSLSSSLSLSLARSHSFIRNMTCLFYLLSLLQQWITAFLLLAVFSFFSSFQHHAYLSVLYICRSSKSLRLMDSSRWAFTVVTRCSQKWKVKVNFKKERKEDCMFSKMDSQGYREFSSSDATMGIWVLSTRVVGLLPRRTLTS